ncbi:hypothetical protein KM043_006134 [Ampulex compressa]|nr:hypothetical protein KM043_006134 [Ampulex compressa]
MRLVPLARASVLRQPSSAPPEGQCPITWRKGRKSFAEEKDGAVRREVAGGVAGGVVGGVVGGVAGERPEGRPAEVRRRAENVAGMTGRVATGICCNARHDRYCAKVYSHLARVPRGLPTPTPGSRLRPGRSAARFSVEGGSSSTLRGDWEPPSW